MSERTFCNCHWSRQVMPYMRHCWNKVFFAIIRVLVGINQIVIMSPFIYLKNSKENSILISPTTFLKCTKNNCGVKWKFRTQRWLTAAAIILFTLYVIVSPFMVKMGSEIYSNLRMANDNIFNTLSKFSLIADVVCFLFIMATNIWHRENIVKVLNLLNEIIARFERLEKNLIGFKTFLAVMLKTIWITYDVALTVREVIKTGIRYSTQTAAGYFFAYYMHVLESIFELNIFIFFLLFLTCSLQLEKELQCSHVTINDSKMTQLISLQDALQKLVLLFRTTFQFGIFVIILLYFVTILCNIYAMLDYYVTTDIFFATMIMYAFSSAVQLYSLICVAHLWQHSQRQVKDLFLQREELYSLQSSNSLSIVEMDALWPQLHDFQLLGLFTLNNAFALYLITYSVNFLVIIFEFEYNKKVRV